VAQAILASWSVDPGLVTVLLLLAALYARGWQVLRRQMPERFPVWRLACFLGGLVTVYLAIASPIDAFASLLLQVHMLQHLLLMMIAAPLLLLGAPAIALLRGLPPRFAKSALGPFLAWPALQRFAAGLLHPVTCWSTFVAATWLWHLPALYQLALRSPGWHAAEHATFLVTALLFWWPVVQPWPSRPRWPRWTIPVYLLLADVQNTIFSALLAFSEHLFYPVYASVPRLGGISPLDDQVVAGAIMWVPGSVVFLVPTVLITARLLSPPSPAPRPVLHRVPPARRPAGDVLRLPVIGAALRRPLTRRAAQAAMLLVAVAVVADGLMGPSMSPMNLAGVLPWTGWRALTVVALLVAGNVFCFACPFMLPRELARRFTAPARRLPRPLRTKWLAVVLLVAGFWATETFALWDGPRATAWIIVGYFAAALLVDSTWRGATFCKYVCPIGQFHFVNSLVSPLQVRARAPAVCATCTTHDCLRGNATRRGCELDLFMPRKVGNLDCTVCLDCVHACPHDNIGIFAAVPGSDLVHDARRSSIGRLSQRLDVVALAVLLVVAAFVMAGVMVVPISWRWLLVALAVPPLGVAAFARLGWRRRARPARFALALLPLGLSMWTAHFLFHLLTGWGTFGPVLRRPLADLGLVAPPHWTDAPALLGPGPVLGLQLLLLDVGLLLTLWVAWRVARDGAPRARRVFATLAPWAGAATALWAVGVWILCQPMAMRGIMSHP
jgi:cytochrome c oxidase assembly factor CtaG